MEQHLIIDLGPNALTFGLALLTCLGTISANILIHTNGRKIDKANGQLASKLVEHATAKQSVELGKLAHAIDDKAS